MITGPLQPMMAWAEDRALLRSNPSADPGAKIGDGAAAGRSAPFTPHLRDWHQRVKPSRPEAVIHRQDASLSLANAKRSEFQFMLNQDVCSSISISRLSIRNDHAYEILHPCLTPMNLRFLNYHLGEFSCGGTEGKLIHCRASQIWECAAIYV